ncbi:sensor histidine kinase [Microbacterium sp. NPDC058342]|uniref:sensor histidine kinase n=1 Tax=Microbacterium sp. NPDC058342 TaxID=3346454 RepID=UPI00365D1736
MVADALRAPRARDVVVAAATGAVAIIALLLLPGLLADAPETTARIVEPGTATWWLTVFVVFVQCLLLSWARHAPRTAVVAVAAVSAALALTAPGPLHDITAFAIPVAVYLVFRRPPLTGLRLAATGAAALFLAGSAVNGVVAEHAEALLAVIEAAVQTAGVFGIPVLLAVALRSQQDSRDAQDRELLALTRERDALVEATVARERTAMARELHDIAAHHLSGIALMAATIERQAAGDPAAARESARQIRAESTAVLQNLRRVVGLLRDGAQAELTVEGFASIPDLVRSMSAPDGPAVELRMPSPDGPAFEGVGPLAQLAAYRTVQEALANVTLHAPGADGVVEIDDTDPAAVHVRVRNGAPTRRPTARSQGGYGLVGMRERADLIGARLHCGPTPDGGWEVRLEVPRDPADDGGSQKGVRS